MVVSHLLADGFFGFEGAFSKQIGGVKELHAVVINKKVRPTVTAVVQHDAIPSCSFKGNGKPTARKTVTDETCQR